MDFRKKPLRFLAHFLQYTAPQDPQVIHSVANWSRNKRAAGLMFLLPYPVEDTEIIIVHDGVRPFIKSDIIRRSIETARQKGACIAAVPVKDTIKEVTGDRVIRTIPRDTLYQVQTPQTFKYEILVSAHRLAAEKNYYSTDESSLVEWAGYPVTVVNGSYENIKITTREDYFMAVQILERMS